MNESLPALQTRIAVLRAAWKALPAPPAEFVPAAWPVRLSRLQQERAALIGAGLWRSGPRSLMGALRQQHSELALTAGLGWLLRPDGHHGLGDAPLRALLTRLGLGDQATGRVRVRFEEAREDTRADLVVTSDGWSVLIEAKTFADEQPRQCDRLHALWRDGGAQRFVFLTRTAGTPRTAVDSREHWTPLSWYEVAQLLRALPTLPSCPGAVEYLLTLEAYHRVN